MNSTAEETVCPGCHIQDDGSFLTFFRLPDVPVNSSALLNSESAARTCLRGEIELTLCYACGLIFNRRFDARRLDYDESYDNTLDYSPVFRCYAESLAETLRQRHDLRRKRIIEIGSGQGNFLKLLSAGGENQCVGYDPTFDPNAKSDTESGPTIRFVQDYYSERYASEPVDFVACRHVLEHMPEPLVFLEGLRKTLSSQSNVDLYFEVPNARQVLDGPALWDVIYQHVHYFTEESLESLFRRAGFTVTGSGLSFKDQYLWVESGVNPLYARASSGRNTRSASVSRLATNFADRFRNTLLHWSACLENWMSERRRIAFWGAGTKGVTFLNVVTGAREISSVVDLNPRKQGMYVPGTGQRIVRPTELTREQPEIVITLNPAYVEEIGAMLRDLRISAEIATFPAYGNG